MMKLLMNYERKFTFTERESKTPNTETNQLTCTQNLNFLLFVFQLHSLKTTLEFPQEVNKFCYL